MRYSYLDLYSEGFVSQVANFYKLEVGGVSAVEVNFFIKKSVENRVFSYVATIWQHHFGRGMCHREYKAVSRMHRLFYTY